MIEVCDVLVSEDCSSNLSRKGRTILSRVKTREKHQKGVSGTLKIKCDLKRSVEEIIDDYGIVLVSVTWSFLFLFFIIL